MSKLIRFSALYILIIILFSLSFIILNTEGVDAANVCCEKTKGGQFCEYVDQSQCAADSKVAAANCEFTSFCKLGCGFDLSDGRCYKNTPYSYALSKDQTFGDNPSCNLPQCDVGCCILGTEASLATQTRCKVETAKYPDLQMVFKPEIKDELTCLNAARSQDKGACKISNDECKYTTRVECNLPAATDFNGTGFFKDIYCSDQRLGTSCTPSNPDLDGEGERKGCLSNEEDVYYFDSCGNPEDVAENCDYVTGTLCGEKDGKYSCLPLDCDVLGEDFKPVDKFVKENPWNPNKIKNGESWCESDSGFLGGGEDKSTKDNRVGFGRDIPGSRYYNRLCVNNKIFTEPCKDFRQERCVSTVPGSGEEINNVEYHEAKCRPNRYQDCNSCNDKTKYLNEDDMITCCDNTNIRDCSWQSGNKKCVLDVPPGSKFWAGEGSDKCAIANNECDVVIYVSGLSKYISPSLGKDTNTILRGVLTLSIPDSAVRIIAGKNCLSKDYIIAMNNLCRAQGDCGADFNVINSGTTDGFSGSGEEQFSKTIQKFLSMAKVEKFPPKIETTDLENWGGTGIPSGRKQVNLFNRWGVPTLTILSRTVKNALFTTSFKEGVWKGLWEGIKPFSAGLIGVDVVPKAAIFEKGIVTVGEEVYKEALKDKIITESVKDLKGEQLKIATESIEETLKSVSVKDLEKLAGDEPVKEIQKQLASESVSGYLTALNVYMTVSTIASLADAILADTLTAKVTTACNPWVAPAGSTDCSKCNPDDKDYIFKDSKGRKCSEYMCKSLGQSCALINQGTGNETCVSQNPNDVNAPVISEWKDALGDYKDTDLLNYGYKYNKGLPPFTKFPIAIKTDEPSQCKVSFNHSVKYDEMQPYFLGSPLYEYNHYMILDFPTQNILTTEGKILVRSGGDYKLYVRCQDSLKNANERDYIIQFTIASGPDLTPPSIEGTSIVSGSYFKNKAQETELTIFVNEPAECKWSNLDTGYDNMENKFECKNTINALQLYECTTELKPLIDDIENKFYFRCKDNPGVEEANRNVMEQSYKFSLRGTLPLELRSIEPSGDIFTNNITLKAETYNGAYKDGTARCGYSDKDEFNSMVEFAETNSSIHKQILLLEPGTYTYYVMCVDDGGNIASNKTEFKIAVDTEAPKIARIYEDTSYTPSHLKIVLNEASICEYGFSDFEFGKGNRMPEDNSREHDALFNKDAKYYIRCRDLYNNYMPLTIVYT